MTIPHGTSGAVGGVSVSGHRIGCVGDRAFLTIVPYPVLKVRRVSTRTLCNVRKKELKSVEISKHVLFFKAFSVVVGVFFSISQHTINDFFF